MISIIRWNLWQRRWSIFWWCIAIFAFVFLNLAFYPSIRDQAAELNNSLAQIPESAKGLFTDTADFLSPTGYLSSQIFYLMLPMLLGILAISQGASLLAREEKDGTIELLLSRPVSRSKLLSAKAITGVLICLLAGIVGGLTSVIMSRLVDLEISATAIALASLATLLLSLSFGAVAFLLTAFGRARVASIGLSALFALGGYMIASLKGTAEWLKYPAKAFPFDYYKPAAILDGSYNWWNMSFIVGTIIICAVVSWLIFRRRDINTN